MANSPISLEYYPKVPANKLALAKQKITTNKENWDAPFFMDVCLCRFE